MKEIIVKFGGYTKIIRTDLEVSDYTQNNQKPERKQGMERVS